MVALSTSISLLSRSTLTMPLSTPFSKQHSTLEKTTEYAAFAQQGIH